MGLIKYNKFFQNIVDKNLINYKSYTDKYIIYENERKGKLYNVYDERLLFEGEFLNGKKNGKGKEYGYYGDLIFKGEYLNGIINGKGKEYFDNGNIKYEGNYFNGFRHGECIEYYYNGTIRFKGEYLYGKIWNGKVFDFYWNKFFEITIFF